MVSVYEGPLSKQTKVNINKHVKSVYQSCAGCCALNKHKQILNKRVNIFVADQRLQTCLLQSTSALIHHLMRVSSAMPTAIVVEPQAELLAKFDEVA